MAYLVTFTCLEFAEFSFLTWSCLLFACSPPHNTDHRIKVDNLPSDSNWQDLKDHFRQAGKVCFSEVYKSRDETKGIVEFETADDMKNAVKTLDKSKLRGNTIYVSEDRPRSRTPSPKPSSKSPPRQRSPSPKPRSPSPNRGGGAAEAAQPN